VRSRHAEFQPLSGRHYVERGTTQATGGTASYLIDVLGILAEIEAENFNQPATQHC